MDHSATFFLTVLAAFFAIMNPMANTPIFLGLTQDMDEKTTREVAPKEWRWRSSS
jgi:multiple antibiotic resistance protein